MKFYKLNIIFAMAFVLASLTGCFEEDTRIPPHTPGDELTYSFTKSIYENQSFFKLGINDILAENENPVWLLRFASQADDWHIGINSSNFFGVYNSGTTDIGSVSDNPPVQEWVFDKSSGEPDSTAFAGWVKFLNADTIYSNFIYLIGRYDGIGYSASWATQFLSVTESAYKFRIMDWPDGSWKEYEVKKDPGYNYQYFTASEGGGILQIEPDRDLWDLLFTQYGSILYTDEGIPTPYYVRGVLLNPNTVETALDSINSFESITFNHLPEYSFSRRRDFIGYDWKDVEVDENSNTAVYTVNSDKIYIIRDTEGFYYKFRFISYYNDLGEKGFPVFEHKRL